MEKDIVPTTSCKQLSLLQTAATKHTIRLQITTRPDKKRRGSTSRLAPDHVVVVVGHVYLAVLNTELTSLMMATCSINSTPAVANSTRQSTNRNCNFECWFRRPLMSRKFFGCCSKDTLQQENLTGNCCFGDFIKILRGRSSY